MAALLQSYPQPSSSTITMLHTRSASTSDILQNSSSSQTNKHTVTQSLKQRNGFHSMNLSNYCAQSTVTPIAPYAFTSTPELNAPGQSSAKISLPKPELDANRTTVSVKGPVQNPEVTSRAQDPSDTNRTSTKSTVRTTQVASDSATSDSISLAPSNQNSSPSQASTSMKNTPGRYRRAHSQRTESGDELKSSVAQFSFGNTNLESIGSFKEFNLQMPQLSDFTPTRPASSGKKNQMGSHEALSVQRPRGISESSHKDSVSAQAMLRLSINTNIRTDQHASCSSPSVSTIKSESLHLRQGSDESLKSARSSRSRAGSVARPRAQSTARQSAAACLQSSVIPLSTQDVPRFVDIPPRASSTHATKRTSHSSPLSQPVDTNGENSAASATKDSFASTVNAALQQPSETKHAYSSSLQKGSPAAHKLFVLNEKDEKKSKTSRLRRALSFGSAAELRRASAENRSVNLPGDVAKLRKGIYEDELDAEQTKIAQQQEAGGIGSGIYSGQGNFFGGSTDNISISSTASSASVMIRKMGNGMKKSTRSLVGLFRPKSVIGVPAADSAVPISSGAQVSMVTVEAEREIVGQLSKPESEDTSSSGTLKIGKLSLGLENTSLVSDLLGNTGTENASKKSMSGAERERADFLAAAKKGILKKSVGNMNNSTPESSSVESNIIRLSSPQTSMGNESPNSTAPSTPNDENQGPPRAASVALGSEDYFMSALRYPAISKSHPGTPHSPSAKRNATFSPRIQFHDTWPSGEYDRRGEIATCNRLTPMLAQQIKEELNNFKMEMEVHETSKIYTHFF
ncbi:hypothetical protein K3495_g317 [Podosphaera aphanis]|nr:hypothetical protein K3495_g317 [Podosphaera aphanis]